MTPRANLLFLRRFLLAGTGLCLAVAAGSVLRYPGVLVPWPTALLVSGLFALALLSYLAAAVYSTRGAGPGADLAARLGLGWGLLTAGFWAVEVAAGNLAAPRQFGVPIVYFGAAGLAYGSPLLAGVHAGGRSGHVLEGTLAGLWSGLVSGLLTFLVIMGVAFVFLDTLLLDPENRSQFRDSGAPDLATFVIGDCLAGATGHLIIGLVLAPTLGAAGGVLGKGLAGRAPSRP
jgi:hypothetical protein